MRGGGPEVHSLSLRSLSRTGGTRPSFMWGPEPWASLEAQTVNNFACNAGDTGLIPGSGRSPGEGKGNPLQYSCMENSMDRGARQASVHGIAKSRTQLCLFISPWTNGKMAVVFFFFFFIPVPLLIMVLDSLLQDQWLLSSVLTCDEVRVRRNILGSQRATYES